MYSNINISNTGNSSVIKPSIYIYIYVIVIFIYFIVCFLSSIYIYSVSFIDK